LEASSTKSFTAAAALLPASSPFAARRPGQRLPKELGDQKAHAFGKAFVSSSFLQKMSASNSFDCVPFTTPKGAISSRAVSL